MKLTVTVQPNASSQRAEVAGSNAIKVWVRSKPQDGKANKELTQFLKRIIKKSTGTNPRINILQGTISRSKKLDVDCTWAQISTAVRSAESNITKQEAKASLKT